MSEDLKQDQKRRCNDGWAICMTTDCGLTVFKDQGLCPQCNKFTHADLKKAYATIFAKEAADQSKQISDRGSKTASGATGSGTAASKIEGALESAFEKYVNDAMKEESDHWTSICKGWGKDVVAVKQLVNTLYTSDDIGKLTCASGKMEILNLIRNTEGAVKANGGKTKSNKEILDNLLILLDDGESAGILTALS